MTINHTTEICPHCHMDTGYNWLYLMEYPQTKCPNCNQKILGK